MSIIHNIDFYWQDVPTSEIHLNKDEWILWIKNNIIKINSKFYGNILIEKLNDFIVYKNCRIKFYNRDPNSNSIYPKIKFIDNKNVIIIIPNVPYFNDIETINKQLCEDTDDQYLNNFINVLNYKPSKLRININEYNYLVSYTRNYSYISLAHELIHCLRFSENISLNTSLEEDNTIYGIKDDSILKYLVNGKKIYITENTIRKDWNLPARVSHNSKELYCYQVFNTYSNKDNFTKNDFFL